MRRIEIGTGDGSIAFHTTPAGSRREYADRTGASDEAFEAHLLGWELRSEVDIAADVAEDEAVERVARAISDVDHAPEHGSSPPWDEVEPEFQDNYRKLARAALSVIPEASR